MPMVIGSFSCATETIVLSSISGLFVAEVCVAKVLSDKESSKKRERRLMLIIAIKNKSFAEILLFFAQVDNIPFNE